MHYIYVQMFDIDDLLSSDEKAERLAEDARRLQERQVGIDAEQAELVLELERIQAGGCSPFRNTEAFLRQATGMTRWTARTRVQVFRQLLVLPTMRQALADGWVTLDHVRALADLADSPNRDAVIDDEAELAEWAFDTTADDYRSELAVWVRDLDEARDAGLSDHERQRRRRRVTRSRTKDGLRRTVFELDDEADATFFGAIRDAAAEMQRADRKAKLPLEQQRPFRQILADAAVEVAHRSRGADVITKHRARPVILAMTEMSALWDQLRVKGYCELADGTKLTAAQIRRMACEADIIPMVLDSNGVPLDMGRAVRFATYNQRLSQRAMHTTCAAEGCDVDFDWCEIHHLKPWERGGLTDQDNLVPLCSYHHHWVHECGFNPEILPDRTLRFTPFALTPAPQRRRQRDLSMGTSPPDPVPTRG